MLTVNKHIQFQVTPIFEKTISHGQYRRIGDHHEFQFVLCKNEFVIEPNDELYSVTIRIHQEYFEKYPFPVSFSSVDFYLCCNTYLLLNDLIQFDPQGLQHMMLLESNILKLTANFLSNSMDSLGCQACEYVKIPISKENILLAKNFILQHLDEKLTIAVIAKQTSTNECYLKKGFKEYIGKTIFEFIFENRMVMAKHLIEESDCSLIEIANKSGYSSLSSFSQAFKNHFGLSPSVLSRQNLV